MGATSMGAGKIASHCFHYKYNKVREYVRDMELQFN